MWKDLGSGVRGRGVRDSRSVGSIFAQVGEGAVENTGGEQRQGVG